MKVKALKNFTDLKENKRRIENEGFEVSEERFEEINSSKYGLLVEEVKEENSLLDGNVEEVKSVLEGLEEEALKDLLEQETANKNRKGVIEHIEGLLKVGDN